MKQCFLVDKDVLTLLRISRRTLQDVMRHGPSSDCATDLRLVKPIRVGNGKHHSQRRWSVGKFAEVTGITREEIWATLS